MTTPVAEHVVSHAAEWRWTRGDTVRTGAAAVALVVTGMVASHGVPAWEGSTFEFLNGLPSGLYPVVWPVMQLGSLWGGLAVAVAAAALIRRPRPAVILVVTPVTAWLLAKVVKTVVQRGRPIAVGLTVEQRGGAETGLGFISGHTTVAFALAAALAPHLRRPWRGVLLGLAGVVGLARLYVGVHLPLDVLGGAACGLLVGEAARVVELRARRRPGGRPLATAGLTSAEG